MKDLEDECTSCKYYENKEWLTPCKTCKHNSNGGIYNNFSLKPIESEQGMFFKKTSNNIRDKVFSKQVGGNHYKTKGIPDNFPDPAEFCMTHKLGLAEGNIIKYVFRHKNKKGIEDLRKAKQYLEFIAVIDYNETL